MERLIVNRPHPWGLLVTFIELIKNPQFKFWNHQFVRCAPEIEKYTSIKLYSFYLKEENFYGLSLYLKDVYVVGKKLPNQIELNKPTVHQPTNYLPIPNQKMQIIKPNSY